MSTTQHPNNQGLTEEQVAKSRATYGANLLTPPPQTPWWKLYIEKFKDPIIIILLFATAISLVVGIVEGNFTESIGIIVAILLATGVGFWQEYSAKRKFDALRNDKDFEPVKVRRDGVVVEITKDQMVVGDVAVLSAGDEIPADIRLYAATDMKVSESAMTGESVAVSKYPMDEEYTGSGFAPYTLLRGTTIEQGFGEGVVVAVGDATEIGKTTRQASEETNTSTPLEEKLGELAHKINIIAFGIAALMFIMLNLAHWDFAFGEAHFAWDMELLKSEIMFLMGAVVVVIVAVPEGLPLSVTLALAFSMKTMARENNLVKKMHACETIGAVNVIFTDKTGTLTQNRMRVVDESVVEGRAEAFRLVGVLNSTAEFSGEEQVLGNPTESAILLHTGFEATKKLREDWEIEDRIPFSSAYKYMVTAAHAIESGEKMLMIKGAPEVISRIIGRDDYLAEVAQQQDRGRRAISAALIEGDFATTKAALEAGEGVKAEYLGSWFIEDPVRGDVPEAIAKCYGAGIDVVMMTGDNIKTGSEIARQAGFKNVWAIEAKDFWTAIEHPQQGREFPNVITRCTPTNKLDILKWAQGKRLVCAMTGDGVNDSPSLNYADVGIAMGSGTSVAKEAADIVLLDDAFPSIVTGVKWGRSLYKNIKNFLFFQLSINVSACLIAIFGPIVGVAMPFTVMQFLWINLVMDSLAAMALASQPADERVLKDKPRPREEFIINRSLMRYIFGFGGVVWLVSTLILLGMAHPQWIADMGIGVVSDFFSHMNKTSFFAAYMVLNLWNMFNARVIGKGESIFYHLASNVKFLAMVVLIFVCTVLIVNYGGDFFQTEPLSWQEWLWIVAATSPVVVLRELWFQLFGRRNK